MKAVTSYFLHLVAPRDGQKLRNARQVVMKRGIETATAAGYAGKLTGREKSSSTSSPSR